MNRKLMLLTLASVGIMTAAADVTVNFPAGTTAEYEVYSQLISDALKGRGEAADPVVSTVSAESGKNVIKAMPEGAARYVIDFGNRESVMVYATPEENITVDITSVSPLEYTVKGSALMEGISLLRPQADAIEKEYRQLARGENPDRAKLDALGEQYDNLFKDYIKANPTAPAAAYAVYQLDGEDFLAAFDAMTPEARASIFYPVTESKKSYVEHSVAAEKHRAEMQSGNYDAPAFTFKNMEGKEVSLSDFRGKWVIIDFWGSWCPWCIKGFPGLKEAYSKYAGKLEIVGIACNDPETNWRAAVEKYQLPWVNLYNPEPKGGKLLEDYAVEGFPTKVIVNPEGKIANITVGEDPAFFDKLAELLK